MAPTGGRARRVLRRPRLRPVWLSTGRRHPALIKGARGVSNHVAPLDDTGAAIICAIGYKRHWSPAQLQANYRLNKITALTRFVFAALATARRHDFISSGTVRLLLTGTTGTTTTGSSGASGTTSLTARQVIEAVGSTGTTTGSAGASGTTGSAARAASARLVSTGAPGFDWHVWFDWAAGRHNVWFRHDWFRLVRLARRHVWFSTGRLALQTPRYVGFSR